MEESTSAVEVSIPPNKGLVAEWAADQKAFKGVPWGKAMMWIFLVSIFYCQGHCAPACY